MSEPEVEPGVIDLVSEYEPESIGLVSESEPEVADTPEPEVIDLESNASILARSESCEVCQWSYRLWEGWVSFKRPSKSASPRIQGSGS